MVAQQHEFPNRRFTDRQLRQCVTLYAELRVLVHRLRAKERELVEAMRQLGAPATLADGASGGESAAR